MRDFGHDITDGRPFWTADFTGDGKSDVMFYYPGDHNWWLGSFKKVKLAWVLAGKGAGFEDGWRRSFAGQGLPSGLARRGHV